MEQWRPSQQNSLRGTMEAIATELASWPALLRFTNHAWGAISRERVADLFFVNLEMIDSPGSTPRS